MNIIQLLNDVEVKLSLDKWQGTEDGSETQPLQSVYDIKKNKQSKPAEMDKEIRALISAKMYANVYIDSVICPKLISVNFFNEYEKDGYYNKHIDSFKASPKHTNVFFDYGFSVCLSDDYEGGEFIVENELGEVGYTVKKGQVILFPIIYPHGVSPIKKGTRKAIIGWLSTNVSYEQSFILRNLFEVNMNAIKEKQEAMVLKSTLVQNYLKKQWGK